MARMRRLTAQGLAHHLIQRGNNRQPTFLDEIDCSRYLADLSELSATHGVAIHAYVLMPNHVHLLATPSGGDSLARLMQSLGRRYVRRFNDRHRRTGTLWEGRYRSTVVQTGRYLLACMRYIDLNPVRAGLVSEPWAYRWSSCAHYLGLRIDPLVTEHSVAWALGNTPFERQVAYRKLFETELSPSDLAAIRYSTHGGWALGQREFVASLAIETGRRATPGQRGRPRKSAT